MTHQHHEADVVVVGAGTAGWVLANRLTADPRLRVILIEAGGEATDPRVADPAAWPFLQGTEVDWDFLTTPQPGLAGRAHPWPRGRVMGGSSAIHAMGHMRGHPSDFDAWSDAGATGWNWDALRPYFVRSETSPFAGEDGYGGEGPLALCQPATPHPLTRCHIAAGSKLGLTPTRDHNGPRMAGPTLNTLSIKNGARLSSADAYLSTSVRARSNLKILTDVLVDRLVIGPEGRATGVVGLAQGQPVTISGSRAVVLAAGTIGSPSILMRSGLGPAEELAALGIAVLRDMPGVGRNLQDHLLAAGNVYQSRQPVPRTTTQHSESLTYITAKGADPAAPPDLVVGVITVPVVSDGLVGLADAPAPGEGYTLLFGQTHPRSRGRLWLTSPDPGAKPMIDAAYLQADEDCRLFVEALDWARRIGMSESYADWRQSEVFPQPEDLRDDDSKLAFIRRAAISHHHPIGTCRMGTDRMAVVRPDLSVPGVPGLFIADGSILPSLTTGPVNAAILAVAERASDMILGGLAH